ncbi:MAG: hypothetical protein RQ867_06035 [Mariprofundaceae bacterium]|nr:hypothetical protein [Mariprofundaceae bacterium]
MNQASLLTITLPFSFKGKTFRPACRINLDEMMEKGSIPCLYTHLANENRIDVHSYEYDVMMMGELEFNEAEGMVAEFVHDGVFDSEGFQTRWHERKVHNLMQDVATRCMGIEQLEEHADLRKALLEAYRLGAGGSESG